MKKMVSKSQCKPKALEYFREVAQTGKELYIGLQLDWTPESIV